MPRPLPPRASAYTTAVGNAHDNGVAVVVAAGNSANDACGYSPAFVPRAITVGSTTNEDTMSSFSNYGPCMDIFAPGSSITAAWVGSDSATNTISGTSMACPHVAGAAAMLRTAAPNLTPDQVSFALACMATTGAISGLPSGTPDRFLYTGAMSTPDCTFPPASPPAPPPAPWPPADTPGGREQVRVSIIPDQYPEEISWDLTFPCSLDGGPWACSSGATVPTTVTVSGSESTGGFNQVLHLVKGVVFTFQCFDR